MNIRKHVFAVVLGFSLPVFAMSENEGSFVVFEKGYLNQFTNVAFSFNPEKPALKAAWRYSCEEYGKNPWGDKRVYLLLGGIGGGCIFRPNEVVERPATPEEVDLILSAIQGGEPLEQPACHLDRSSGFVRPGQHESLSRLRTLLENNAIKMDWFSYYFRHEQ